MPPTPSGADPASVKAYLDSLNTSDRARAAAFDAMNPKTSDEAAQRLLQSLPFSDEVKASMWDIRRGATVSGGSAPKPAAAEDFMPRDSYGGTWATSLPTVGGMAGSLVGGSRSNPVGMVLAGIGGAGGEGWRQTIESLRGNWDQVPPDVRSRVTRIVEEGIKQGGLEGAGRYVIGPLMRMFGRGIYRAALKPAKAIRDEFGARSVVDTLVSEGVPITRSGAGTEKVGRLLSDAGADTAQAIAQAEQSGVKPGTIRPVLKSLQATDEAISNRVVRSPARQQVADFRQAALADNPGRIPVTRMQSMKQAEQDLAVKAYQAAAKGAPINSIETSMHEDLARGLREAIERRVPGIRNKNLRTQQLIGALKAVSGAENRIANRDPIGMGDLLSLGTGYAGTQALGPQGAAIGIIQEVLTRPEIASRLGIALDRAGKPIITPQVLRSVMGAVQLLDQPQE